MALKDIISKFADVAKQVGRKIVDGYKGIHENFEEYARIVIDQPPETPALRKVPVRDRTLEG